VKVNLTQKEIEYILFLISRFVESSPESASFANEYTEEDLELIDKLESALKLLEIEKFGLGEISKNKHLN
jgi:hypothetical protein